MDSYLFEQSLDDSKPETIALRKKILYAQDTNSGVYNSMIRFDTSGLSNSGLWLAWREAVIEIPFIVSFTSTADLTATARTQAGAFVAGLKNGYYNIIDSIQVDYNNTNVVQQSNNINQFCNFKLLTTMSQSDVDKWGASIGFCPDTPAYVLGAAVSSGGTGLSNNRNIINPPAAAAFNEPFATNSGFLQRQRETTAYSANANARSGTIAFANSNTVGKNLYTSLPEAGGANAVYYYSVLCTIRLSDLCDFFDKMPLVKGGFFKIEIVYNSTSHTIACVAGADATMEIIAGNTTIRSGRTCPYLISSAAANNGARNVVNANNGTNLIIDSGVARTTQIANPLSAFNTCRIYVPGYELDPVKESQLLQIKPIRKVNYNDVYMFQFFNIAAGSNFNQYISTGLKNMKYIVLIPSYNNSDANINVAARIPNAAVSPFDTYPATGHPFAAITNFNVQIAGSNIFQDSYVFDFLAFQTELATINAINGGAEMGLTSGLISQSMWDNGYRFYCADLSRRAAIEDGVAKSVQVLGTNSSPYAIDIICFVAYEKSVSIDMAEGKLVA